MVLCRASKHKLHLACLPYVVAVFFNVRARDPYFLCPWFHRSRGTAQVTSIASLDERQVRAVAFTAGIHCFSAEQLLDTRKRSRQNKKQEYMWGLWEGSFVPTASF